MSKSSGAGRTLDGAGKKRCFNKCQRSGGNIFFTTLGRENQQDDIKVMEYGVAQDMRLVNQLTVA